jgi:hypothetical protein
MVVTSRILQDRLGIDATIADYFANKRPVPADNLFWKNKRIYLSVGFGYLTIPFAFDLMYKCGLSEEQLLDDQHVTLMEQGFDRLKRYELKELSLPQFIKECSNLLHQQIRQKHLAEDLIGLFTGNTPRYFQFETIHKALARSDFFLFTLVDLAISDEWVHQFLPYWYALARPILLLDDFKDLAEDRRNNDENTIIELGNNREGVLAAHQLGLQDTALLAQKNRKLAKHLEELLNEAILYPQVREVLNQ